jgi:Ca2+:H+ antiporter
VVISAFNFLAIIPLSALVSDASDTIGNRWGSLVGGLVNATFGNTVELIVGVLSSLELRMIR